MASVLLGQSVQAKDIEFSGGASGVDPLGHSFAFDGTTFTLSSGSGTFNPSGTDIGNAKSFSFSLTNPAVFNPDPVSVPNACPPGQYAVELQGNPLKIVCVAFGKEDEEFIRYTWQYRMLPGGVITFNDPRGAGLTAGLSKFDFTLTFPQPIDVNNFSFTAKWSDVASVPEPSLTTGLLLLGFVGLYWTKRT
ncbi:hypothetical protein [Microcystis sp. M31BS1]|nr:hypothetical protein [Microcystis sp. M31BS1]